MPGRVLRGALFTSIFLGALPPVDLRAVCLVRPIAILTYFCSQHRPTSISGSAYIVSTQDVQYGADLREGAITTDGGNGERKNGKMKERKTQRFRSEDSVFLLPGKRPLPAGVI